METVIRGAVMYFVLMVIIRFSGRRTLAQMTAFDLILVLIVSETAQQALVGNDFSIINAIVIMATLFGIDIALSYLKRASPLADKLMDGRPTVLVTHGRPDERALSRSRVAVEDILAIARENEGLERLDQIKYAVLETGGQISVIPEDAAK
jgi:uncharacterized membrane protein YcaP (DUF421 family)